MFLVGKVCADTVAGMTNVPSSATAPSKAGMRLFVLISFSFLLRRHGVAF
jgi:hypothetical protein